MMKILIIDNERLLMDELKSIFLRLRWDVKMAITGHDGICMSGKEYFDIIIIDLLSIGFDGDDVARHIRLVSKNWRPMVVGVSEKERVTRKRELDYLMTSPISIETVTGIIKYCNEKSKAASSIRKEVSLREKRI